MVWWYSADVPSNSGVPLMYNVLSANVYLDAQLLVPVFEEMTCTARVGWLKYVRSTSVSVSFIIWNWTWLMSNFCSFSTKNLRSSVSTKTNCAYTFGVADGVKPE